MEALLSTEEMCNNNCVIRFALGFLNYPHTYTVIDQTFKKKNIIITNAESA